MWIQSGRVLPEYPQIRQNSNATYRTRRFRTLSAEERNRAGQVHCIVQQPGVSEPVMSSINLLIADPLGNNTMCSIRQCLFYT